MAITLSALFLFNETIKNGFQPVNAAGQELAAEAEKD
jgi:hypothetical protein